MITTAFLNLANFFIQQILSWFPFSEGFGQSVLDTFATLGSMVASWEWLFPVSDLFICLTVVATVAISIFGWRTIKSIVSHIPWIGGK